MSRVCSFYLCLAAWLASLAAVHGEDAKKPRTDLYGDPLPPGAVARLGTIRLRHGGYAAFSKNGKQLISCAIDREVRSWDVATGKLLRRHQLQWKPHEEASFNDISLSPGGTVAAAYNFDEKTVYLFDTHTGVERGRISSITIINPFLLMTFSLDGEYLAVQTKTKEDHFLVQIWDISESKIRQKLVLLSSGRLSRVAFSPDGKRLAGIAEAKDASGKRIFEAVDLYLWDTATGKLIREQKQRKGIDLTSIAFAPDGKTLALGSRSGAVVRLLAADTLKEKSRLSAPAVGPEEYLINPIFSPDGRYVAASWGTVRHHPNSLSFTFDVPRDVLLWNLAEAKAPRRLRVINESAFAFAPDGKTLACRKGSEIRLYDVASGRLLHNRPGHANMGLALAVSPDGKTLASGDHDGTLRVWDAAKSKQIWESHSRDIRITDCFFSADGKHVAGGNTGGPFFDFQTWEAATGKKLGRIFLHNTNACLHAAILSADGKCFRGVYTKEVNEPPAELISWDAASGKCLGQRLYRLRRKEYSQGVNISAPAAFSADGERLTVWQGDRLGIEDVSTGSLLAKLPEMEWPLAFSPDGRLLLAVIRYIKDEKCEGEDLNELAVIETASGQEVVRLKLKERNKLVFTPDGRGVVESDHKYLRVWDTETGEKLYQMAWPASIAKTTDRLGYPYVPSMAALPGSRVAASMTEGDILVWDLQPSRWPKRKAKQNLDRKEMQSLWSDLAGDARTAYRAIPALTSAPVSTIAFLHEYLPPSKDEKHIERLVADLDSVSFSTREKASRELQRIPYLAEPMLRRALQNRPSVEMRRRIEPILRTPRLPRAEDLRMLRAIAVLERIGTSEAQRLLDKLAGGAAAPETRAAQAALRRLKQRAASEKEGSAP